MRRTKILLMMVCVFMLISCTAGPSGTVAETGSSEEVDTSISEVGSTGGVESMVKENGRLIDDTYYLVDIYSILMFCEKDNDPAYEEDIQLLKGDRGSVEKAIEDFLGMEQTPAVMNAIGVGYMRLDRCEEAKRILDEALEMADDDEERACILNNLGSVLVIDPYDIINGQITSKYDRALEIETDPVRSIMIRANRARYGPLIYLDDAWEEKAAKDIEVLLQDEIDLLGSNQIAGIYSYLSLAECSQGDEAIGYYNKALRLNQEQYQYKAVDMIAYENLRECYRKTGDVEKALECADKRIEAGEIFSLEPIDDRAMAYFRKGSILVKEKEYDGTIQCLGSLLGEEGYALNLKAMMYLKVGEAYYGKEDLSKAEEMVEKAYDLFDRYKKEEGDSDWDIDEMLKQHDEADYNEGDPDYMQWVRDQLKG